MNDEQTNEDDTGGKEIDTPVAEAEKPMGENKFSDVDNVKKEYEELKAVNDKMDSELLRAEQLKAKARQGGRAEAGQSQMTPEEELQRKGEEGAKEIVDAFR